MNKIDFTYSGKLNTLINVTNKEKLDVNYTIDGKTGKTTTTSILIYDDGENMLMITFDYQELKKIVEKNVNDDADQRNKNAIEYIESIREYFEEGLQPEFDNIINKLREDKWKQLK